MGVTINIDTGGTFTDGYFTREEQAERVKVDTTPHDLTECLANCVAEGAKRLGYPNVQALLLDTDVFRFSSTIATNSIITRTGPRIGLLVSAGASTLYSKGESPLFDFLLRKDMVAEVTDPFDEKEIRSHVRRLLVGGARILVVSLENSEADPSGEQALKKIVQRDYPRHYLGAVPCLIASEVTPRPGAERRTATAVVNAYLHPDMVRTLYKADEDLRRQGYPHPLLIVHASGGVARVAKTRAIETYNSGPVGGAQGSARVAREYGIDHAVTMDIGGTSTDVSLVQGGIAGFAEEPEVAGIAVFTPMLAIDAIGGGGGSVARKQDGRYTAGPDSMGAVPGPACYGLGGTQATVTDAEVALGHIDPNWFLGGRRKLDPRRAMAALERIVDGDEVEKAAWGVHRALVQLAADKVGEMVKESGAGPSDFTLFAFGGGGGLFGAEVAKECGIARTFCFAQSPVFSAFGIAGMDLSHVYELPPTGDVSEGVEGLLDRARLDAAGEGFDPSALAFQLEVEAPGGLRILTLIKGAGALLEGTRAVRLRATSKVPHAPITPAKKGGADPTAAAKGKRDVWRPGGTLSATVYDRDQLTPGNVVPGPALVEAVDTTILVPEGSQLTVDRYGTGVIEETA